MSKHHSHAIAVNQPLRSGSFHLSKTLAFLVTYFQQATARFLLDCDRNSSSPLVYLEG
ncbi:MULTISPECIES: hypothetical protein [unclassified Microcoleus]|uniref:hypothetical protein n=1 Tax=unclassified Microcoleus TaxID=2642155 RepID=UPI001D94DB31|nr:MULTISPECIES: hypothetical protein [unclassified Microcoleus]MCC3507298.1 hypothetical protein [Microcoleus sp. PH2017_19_SFW_U_A]MCC3451025.1 hypothetical protein [Microcoleus sp. PH2017_09_SFU_O_A]MCC3475307.1 hypothetical protein [Microcoleus sp. PH2017_13_LAR_U_A]MCC3525364.1 hypothetical protein [Microcoleus sp. PH2017_20_SFW_D_A]MCC3556177.1 hypothetical protein [Microcoleus sp. PH2017_35_SFW_U_B]